MSDDILGAEIDLTILAGRNLKPMDGTGFMKMGKSNTSDPYVKISMEGLRKPKAALIGTTAVVPKTLNPEWRHESFKVHLSKTEYRPEYCQLLLQIFDRDRGVLDADDPMGEVRIPLTALTSGQTVEKWYKVEPCEGCTTTTGDLRVKASVALRCALSLRKEQSLRIPAMTTIACGLGWDMLPGGRAIDLDSSCVSISFTGQVLEEECVHFARLTSRSGAIRHTGDEREGDEDLGAGDDEIILVDLTRVPRQTCALVFLATVASEGHTFRDVKTAKLRLVDWTTGAETCRFMPAMKGSHTALFLARIARKTPDAPWFIQAMGDFDHTARDWGTLIPEVKLFCTDLIPGLQVDAAERVAVMRKGGTIRLSDFGAGQAVPSELVLGLAWDVTYGKDIDLDASAIVLDGNLKVLDIVFFGNLRSNDGSIQHGGDEREGDEKGDDEKIKLRLAQVDPAVKYIGFCINSYSGEELDEVKDASCHLFDGRTYADLARFQMTNTKLLDKHTALLVGVLFRDGDGAWGFEIISEAAMGTMALDMVPKLQAFLRRKPKRDLPPNRLPPGAAQGMLSKTAAGAQEAHRQLFESIDRNHDGHLTREELLAAAPQLQLDPETASSLFAQFDRDHNEALDVTEFRALLDQMNANIAAKRNEIAQLENAIRQKVNISVNVSIN